MVEKEGHQISPNWGYLAREMGLILLWAYVILVAGTVTGLINFRIHAFSTLLGVILLGAWLVRRLLQHKKILSSGIEWAFLAFMAVQLLALLFSPDVRRGLPSVMLYGVYILVFYYVYDLVHHGWPVELIEKTLLITGGIVVGLALFQLTQAYIAWRNMATMLTYAPGFHYRLYAVFGDANLLAAFVNILVPITIGRILVSRRPISRISLGGLLIGMVPVFYYASSRGGFLGDLAAISVLVFGWVGFVSERARVGAQKAWEFLRARPLMLGLIVLGVAAPLVLGLIRALQFQGDATHGPIMSSRATFWGTAWDAFQASPWWGIGPGVYPSAYIQYNAIPPDRPYLHAHSVPFTVAAESGLLGLVGLMVFMVVVIRKVWSSRQGLPYRARVRWVTCVASLAGFCVHSLVDNFLLYPSVGIAVTVLVALLLVRDAEDIAPSGETPRNSFSPFWLLLPGLLIAGFTVYSLRAYWNNEQAINAASAGDWQGASTAFDQAVTHDPLLAHYWLQGGYANGMLAAHGDEAALQRAIELTEYGVTLEPGYALNYANLGALYWQAGHFNQALTNMLRAAELEPQVPVYWLNLGSYAEIMSLQDEARRAYGKFLELQPELSETDFWAQTKLRAEVLTSWMASSVKLSVPESLVSQGRRATAEGDFSSAEKLLTAAWRENDQDIRLYSSLAELALVQGDLEEAEGYLHAALWIQDIASNAEKVMPLLTLAEIDLRRGNSESALIRYRQVYEAVTDYTIYGWGTKGWNPYAWFVFGRRSLPVDILPQLIRPPLPPDLVERLLPLVELHEARGEPEIAQEVHRQLKNTSP